ncbi:MAG TPA: lamin tail domain-containing protein [Anaerolineae bacterium]|nr:lamin tail domain-containing protein [Anaerolineae bacterium]
MVHRLNIDHARCHAALVGISSSLLALSFLLPTNHQPNPQDRYPTNLGSLALSAQEAQTPAPSATTTPDTPTPTPTIDPSPSPTSTSTATPSSTPTPSPEPTPRYPPFSILINEVAWAGTIASPNDEWIELYNPGSAAIDLGGWLLEDGGDIKIALTKTIAPRSYFLLERTDQTTVSDRSADLIYTGAMNNGGETLWLRDPSGSLIDSANAAGGAWPAGDSGSRASMERRGGSDRPGNWVTWNGTVSAGLDAGGNAIHGTPRQANSILYPTPTLTPTIDPNVSPTSTSTATPSSTPTPSPEPTPCYPPFSILINEVAWAGTMASALDEWIELYNPGSTAIDLGDWLLEDGGDIQIALEGILAPRSYFLLERTDDATVSDRSADLIYTGSLNNGGETLWLRDPSGSVIDSANAAGGAWPAGDVGSRASMERRGGSDRPESWVTWNGTVSAGLDAGGNAIHGTPRQANAILYPTPTPTSIPGRVVINEVLIRPHYDWNRSGKADLGDEFIELYNQGPGAVNLCGWVLDDVVGGGARPYTLPAWTIRPRERVALFRARTHISLNDAGDTVHLFDPAGGLVDQIRFIRVKAYNLSYGRLPDGSSNFAYGLWPTPRCANVLFVEPSSLITPSPITNTARWQDWGKCPLEAIPQPLLPRYAKHPAMMRWMLSLRIYVCR